MSQVLTESIARSWGASVAEEVIQTICDGCTRGNLDFSEPDFCPIQVNYGWEGEDEHIMCEVPERGKTGLRVWCTEYEEESMTKKQRNLDGIYFRVKRDGEWANVCYSDMEQAERDDVARRMEESANVTPEELSAWWRRMADLLADQLYDMGEQLGVVCE